MLWLKHLYQRIMFRASHVFCSHTLVHRHGRELICSDCGKLLATVYWFKGAWRFLYRDATCPPEALAQMESHLESMPPYDDGTQEILDDIRTLIYHREEEPDAPYEDDDETV